MSKNRELMVEPRPVEDRRNLLPAQSNPKLGINANHRSAF
jgi:hypothetical protein